METIIFAALMAIGLSLALISLGLYFSTPVERRLYKCGMCTSVLAIGVFMAVFGAIGYCIESDEADMSDRYAKYKKETGADSGNTIYYNGQAVSGSALGITKSNIDNYDIVYDAKDKAVKIIHK